MLTPFCDDRGRQPDQGPEYIDEGAAREIALFYGTLCAIASKREATMPSPTSAIQLSALIR